MAARSLIVGLVLALAATAAAGTSKQDRFEEANGLYWKKHYGEAKGLYLGLVKDLDVRDAVLYFNLGNACFQLKDHGHAVLWYKRALALGPSDDLERRIKENLERTQEAVYERHRNMKRSVAVLDESHGAAYSLFHLLPVKLVAIVFASLWALFFGVLIARRFMATDEARGALRTAAIAISVPLLLAGVVFAGNLWTTSALTRGIVVEENVRLRDGRHRDAPQSDVPEGLEIQIVDQDPTEVKIRLSNGKEGWVPASAIEAI